MEFNKRYIPRRLAVGLTTAAFLLASCSVPTKFDSKEQPLSSAWQSQSAATAVAIIPTMIPVEISRPPSVLAPITSTKMEITDPAVGCEAGQSGEWGDAIDVYNKESTCVDEAADGKIRYYTRDIGNGGRLDYAVIMLDDSIDLEVLHANGVKPATTEYNNTQWADGQDHRESVPSMAESDHAKKDGEELVLVGNGDFFGNGTEEGRTMNNGINEHSGWREALGVRKDGSVVIKVINDDELKDFETIIGGGPKVVKNINGKLKVANPNITEETDDEVPYLAPGFSPDDPAQLPYRKQIYMSNLPQTAIGFGKYNNGKYYITYVFSTNTSGYQVAKEMRMMGCESLGLDNDTSTSFVWNSEAKDADPETYVWKNIIGGGRPIANALGVYVKSKK